MKKFLLAFLLMGSLSGIAFGQVPQIENGAADLAWDYDTPSVEDEFRVYIEQTPGIVPDGNPDATVPNTQLTWLITTPNLGTWYAVVTAFDADTGTESPPSAEVEFEVVLNLPAPTNPRIVIPTPPPAPEEHAMLCPDGLGGMERVAIANLDNQPLEAGCVTETAPMEWFFTGEPYDCSTLRAQDVGSKFYLGEYPWDDGGSISSFNCVDVFNGDDFRAASDLATSHRQVVILVHNDFDQSQSGSNPPFWANKGEVLILGIPEDGLPPRVQSNFAWQATSGNFAVVNLRRRSLSGGSSWQPGIKQTITMYGISNVGTDRIYFHAYEGGGNPGHPNDPAQPIDDEVYAKHVAISGGSFSHNIYNDRALIGYWENLISYDSGGTQSPSAVHPMKLDTMYAYLINSILSNEGIHGPITSRSNHGGMAPLSAVACQQGVVSGTKLLNFTGIHGGGSGAAQAQVRHAIVGCDEEAGWMSNTTPVGGAPVYTGLIQYPYGEKTTKLTEYWDPAYWVDPPKLKMYYLDNLLKVERVDAGTSPEDSFYAVISEMTFPATSNRISGRGGPDFTSVAPPDEWVERHRMVFYNNCFDGGNSQLMRKNAPRFLNCSDPQRPSWVDDDGVWCTNAGNHPTSDWPFEPSPAPFDRSEIFAANQCGLPTVVPQEVQDEVAALMTIPNPPWVHWEARMNDPVESQGFFGRTFGRVGRVFGFLKFW